MKRQNETITQISNYFSVWRLFIKKGRYSHAALMIWQVFVFFYRTIRYQYFFPKKCKLCGTYMQMFFQRSAATVYQGQDTTELYDWLVCMNAECDEAIRFT